MWKLLIIYPKPKQRNLKVWINFPHKWYPTTWFVQGQIQAIAILYIATNLANTPYHLFNPWDEAKYIPQFYDQILRTGARSAIYSNQCPQWNPLFYSIRNNWCQIWWFETPLGKAIFNNDNDDDVAYYLDLWQRKRKAMGEKKITLLTMSFWKPFEVTPSKNKLKNFCLFLFFPI